MNRFRAFFLLLLIAAPILLFVGAGGWSMWENGLLRKLWWWLPLLWGTAFLIGRFWKLRLLPFRAPEFATPVHWTNRDKECWKVVADQVQTIERVPLSRMTNIQFYLETANELSLKVARAAHPGAKDPVGGLTVVEILTAIELAAGDLAQLVDQHLPGSHLMTVDKWKLLAQVPEGYKNVSNMYWVISSLFGPQVTLSKYALAKVVLEPVTKAMQENILTWFYASYVHRVGFYLIELNSGRLRVGSRSYRRSMRRLEEGPSSSIFQPETPLPEHPGEPIEVAITLIGQVNAGKSSLINALCGSRQASTDVLPCTKNVKRYQVDIPGSNERIALLDTAGYGDAGASKAEMKEAWEALKRSSVVLVVMNAASPARDPDRIALDSLLQWCDDHPELNPPPIIGVLTHIDLLKPVMEWSPPYDFASPARPKEYTVRGAIDYVRQQFGTRVTAVLAVCTDVERNRIFGVNEYLLPMLAACLPKARAVAVLQALNAEVDRQSVGKLFDQFLKAGQLLLQGSIFGPPSIPVNARDD